VTVSACFFPGTGSAMKFGNNGFEVWDQQRKTRSFGSQ
jgi:hypothetical protein